MYGIFWPNWTTMLCIVQGVTLSNTACYYISSPCISDDLADWICRPIAVLGRESTVWHLEHRGEQTRHSAEDRGSPSTPLIDVATLRCVCFAPRETGPCRYLHSSIIPKLWATPLKILVVIIIPKPSRPYHL